MVVMKLGAWYELSEEIMKMVAGNIIDALVVCHKSATTGVAIENWVYHPTPAEMDAVYSILPPCKGYEILGREVIKVADRTLRVARINCINPGPS